MIRLLERLPRSGWRADLAAFAAGLLAALSFPPLHALPALLLAVPALLALIGTSPGLWTAARRGFWFGFGTHLIGLYWITEAILLESGRYWWLVPIAVPALSALLALFIAVTAAAARLAAPGWSRALMLAGAWLLTDLARQFIGTGFPWNPWGSVWAIPGPAGDLMIQPAAWVGTPGLTLATVLVAALPTLGRRGWTTAAAILATWIAVGAWRLNQPEPPAPGLKAVLVQGNVAQGQKWDRASAVEIFQHYLDLSAEGVAQAGATPTVVIWPETSSPFPLQSDAPARQAIMAAIAPAKGAIIGSLTFSAGFPSRDLGNIPLNTMLALAPGGVITGTYDKWHLVPFGEYAPTWVPLAIKIVPGQLGFGTGPGTIQIPGIPPFGGLICYEAIFPAQVVDEAHRPDWLVNITNDAWFGNSTGPRQHLAAARLRALEEGLPLMRAANTGISAGFDSRGRELARLPVGVAGQLTVALPGKQPPTPFATYGLPIPATFACLFIVVSVLTGRRRERVPKSRPTIMIEKD